MAPKVEIDMIEIRGTRGPLYWPVTPDPLPREMVIQVLTCYAAEMWWSPIIHETHAYSQLQGNIIKHIRQDISRQSFRKYPVRSPRQPLWKKEWTNQPIPNDSGPNIYLECGLTSCLSNDVWVCMCPDMHVMEITNSIPCKHYLIGE